VIANTTICAANEPFPGLDVAAVFAQIKKHDSKAHEGILHMVKAGELLAMLKKKLPHGQFIKMSTRETGLSRSTISRYMQIAANGARVRHLNSGRDAIDLITKLTSPAPTAAKRSAQAPASSKVSLPLGAVHLDAEIVEPEAQSSPPDEPLTEKKTARLAELEAVIENATRRPPEVNKGDEPEPLVVDGTKPESNPCAMARDFISTLKPLTAWQERQALCDVRDACNRRLEELDKLNGKEKP
jgi:hypothetical protein